MSVVGEALTRKIGPLPAWSYGVGIGGVIFAVRWYRSRQGQADGTAAAAPDTSLSADPLYRTPDGASGVSFAPAPEAVTLPDSFTSVDWGAIAAGLGNVNNQLPDLLTALANQPPPSVTVVVPDQAQPPAPASAPAPDNSAAPATPAAAHSGSGSRTVGPWATAGARDRAVAGLILQGYPVRKFSRGGKFWAEIGAAPRGASGPAAGPSANTPAGSSPATPARTPPAADAPKTKRTLGPWKTKAMRDSAVAARVARGEPVRKWSDSRGYFADVWD